MTLARLKEVCLKNGLYRTPSVNDKLYLHYEGFSEIDGAVLGEYTGLKCLWLQGNGLTKIQGLEKLVLVRSLSLHENCIDTLEGLEMLTALQSATAPPMTAGNAGPPRELHMDRQAASEPPGKASLAVVRERR